MAAANSSCSHLYAPPPLTNALLPSHQYWPMDMGMDMDRLPSPRMMTVVDDGLCRVQGLTLATPVMRQVRGGFVLQEMVSLIRFTTCGRC